MQVLQKGLSTDKQDQRMVPTALQNQPQALHQPKEWLTLLLLVSESQD